MAALRTLSRPIRLHPPPNPWAGGNPRRELNKETTGAVIGKTGD